VTDESLNNVIGPVIRRLRVERGLSQPKLSARCQLDGWDISRDFIAKVEAGRRLVRDIELVKFAVSLGVTPNEIVAEAFAAQVLVVQKLRAAQRGKVS
jgi:transcriptional regulator with XRE-family HTH domain